MSKNKITEKILEEESMLMLIFGIAIFATYVIFIRKIESDLLQLLLLGAGAAVIVTALFIPVSGYQEPEMVEEMQLASLSDDATEKAVFVRVMSNGQCEYKEYSSHATIKLQNAEVYEADVDTAVVKVYNKTPKRTIWTFAFGAGRDEYKIIVPMGTASYAVVK